jgi:hypothetical protein
MAGLLARSFVPITAFPVTQWRHGDGWPIWAAPLGWPIWASCLQLRGQHRLEPAKRAAPNSLFNPYKEPSPAHAKVA